jgi:hypothetical protein
MKLHSHSSGTPARSGLWAFILTCAVLVGVAQAAPKAKVEPLVLDLGEIDEGPQFERTITLTNVGDGLLVLENLNTTCGCTAAATDGTVELKGGESKEIRITFSSKGQDGETKKKITLTTNDPDTRHTEVLLTANVHRPVRWVPRSVQLSGVGYRDDYEQTVSVQVDQELKFDVKSAFVTEGYGESAKPSKRFTVETGNKRHEGTRDIVDLKMKLVPGQAPGMIKESLTIVTNLPGDQETLRVPISGDTQGRIRVSPKFAALRIADPGEEVTRDIVVSASEGTLKIKSAEVPNSPVQVELIPESTTQTLVRLRYVGEEPGANGVRQLRIETDDPDQAVIEISVRYNTRTTPSAAQAGQG